MLADLEERPVWRGEHDDIFDQLKPDVRRGTELQLDLEVMPSIRHRSTVTMEGGWTVRHREGDKEWIEQQAQSRNSSGHQTIILLIRNHKTPLSGMTSDV